MTITTILVLNLISLLNTCSKILERAVHKQLIDHLETNNLLQKRSSVIEKTGQLK